MIPFRDFAPLAEFTDRFGEIRPIAGCSVGGRTEFWDRLKQMMQVLRDNQDYQSWLELFDDNPRFRQLVLRCLELNGIDPDWITANQLCEFLFHRWDDEIEGYRKGWLIELNFPVVEDSAPSNAEPLTQEEIIAAIALTTGNVQQAIDLYNNLRPAQTLLGIVEAIAESKNEKARERKKQKKMEKRLKKELGIDRIKELIQMPVEKLKQG